MNPLFSEYAPERCTEHGPLCEGAAGSDHLKPKWDRLAWQRNRRRSPLPEGALDEAAPRFWTHVDKTEGCWNWTGPFDYKGYGLFYVLNRRIRAHRFSVLWFGRSIPKDMTVDHLCRNKACVNPNHLDVVTMTENVLRGESFGAVNARKTHCIRGHEYDAANTIQRGNARTCRACKNADARRGWATSAKRARRISMRGAAA